MMMLGFRFIECNRLRALCQRAWATEESGRANPVTFTRKRAAEKLEFQTEPWKFSLKLRGTWK